LRQSCKRKSSSSRGSRADRRGGDITITPLIHSTIQIEHAGKVIQFDPWSMLDFTR
jgi:hypothetical protein